MPRSNRPRREPARDTGFDRLVAGWKRSETRKGIEWTVQPVSASQAQKSYTCPGCGSIIDAGVAHVVTWRADGVLGDRADLAARRHWHERCWRIG